MVMGVKKEIADKAREMETDREGVIMGNIRIKKEVWEIWGVYANKNLERVLKILEEEVENREEGVRKLAVGDFNV
jgi:hypothetical protein